MNRPPPLTGAREDTLSEDLLRGRHFSPRQLRLLRKEMLMLRAAVERAEVAEAGAELRHRFSHFGWLKWLAPSWAIGKTELGGLGTLMKKYPIASSLASFAMSSGIRRTAAFVAKPAAKLGVVAFAGWSVWKVWQSLKDSAVATGTGAEPADADRSAGVASPD